MPTFLHHDLILLNPAFNSPLVDVVTELEHLRRLLAVPDMAAKVADGVKAPLVEDMRRMGRDDDLAGEVAGG